MRNCRRWAGLVVLFALFATLAGTTAASASTTRPQITIGAQQLRFFDGRGDIYSVQVFGYNQNGVYINGKANGACFSTPTGDTPIDNWWWLAGNRADVYTYQSSGCPSGQAVQHLWIDVPANPTTYWRCLEDTSPYSDWSCERTG